MSYTTSFFFPTPRIPKRNVTVLAALPTEVSQSTTLTLITGSAALAAAAAAAVSLTDPERRRKQQSESVGGSDKEVVKEYFNREGFERWRKIYGETEEVNPVQRDIRLGHAKTVENAVKMLLEEEGGVHGVRVCDAGCGTGCLAIPLAELGATVYGADISEAMIAEARKQAKEGLQEGSIMPTFEVKDLESLEGTYDTVVCLDVLIHYPQSKADGMISHLASLAENRLILSFAPKTFYYDILKRVGELFPGPSKATRAYLHAEADIERALKKVGWRIRKRGLITTQFYFARLVEAVPA